MVGPGSYLSVQLIIRQCTPEERTWPSQRCDRCIKFGHPCSPNVTSSGQQQTGPSVDDTKDQALTRLLNELSRQMGLDDTGFSCQIYASSEERCFDGLSNGKLSGNSKRPANILKELPIYTPIVPLCVSLFSMLIEVMWSFFGCSRANPLEFDISAFKPFSIHRSLQRRLTSIQLHRSWCELYEAELAEGNTEEQSTAAADAKLVLRFLGKDKVACLEGEEMAKLIHEFSRMRLRGSRWKELVNTIGSQEVLLMNENNDDLWDVDLNPNQVIEEGTEEAFQRCKERLISSELDLKDTCLRLSGISHMILALRKLEDDSAVQKYISEEIDRRVREVFGKPYWDQSRTEDNYEVEEATMNFS